MSTSKAKQESLDGTLKTLPNDVVLIEDLLLMFSAMRREGKISNTTTKPVNPPKQRAFKRIAAGEKSEDSNSSDAVTIATSDSDDGVAQQAVKNVRKKRKAVKREHGDDKGVQENKKHKAEVEPKLPGDGAA